MIDLHLHLDGSLSLEDFTFLASKYNIELGKDFPNNVYVAADCPSLTEYLTRFDLPLNLMQTEFSISYVTKNLVIRLANMGLIYAEIRFAPQLHTQNGLTQYEVVNAAVKGLKEGLKATKDFDANLILCMMRHGDELVNMETIEVANKFRNDGVCAIDLAGDETLHPCSYYSKAFQKANEYNLNITIHGGEATGNDEIMLALENGANRIGHGVHLSLDAKSIHRVKEKHICFEFCPTSNLQTKSLPSYNSVPLRDFMNNGVMVTINSDNMTVSNTDVIQEYKRMVKTFNLSEIEVLYLLNNSIQNAFIADNKKYELRKRLAKKISSFYARLFD